jgi:hypothetical protein
MLPGACWEIGDLKARPQTVEYYCVLVPPRKEAMLARRPSARTARSEKLGAAELRARWDAAYGPLLAKQLEPSRRYSLFRVGSAEFAYTRYDQYVQALGQVWTAGLVPEPLPSALGSDFPDAAPGLRGVDLDLSRLDADDIAPPLPLP